jgi:digeranylgeranylglycerophospholipid reductase
MTDYDVVVVGAGPAGSMAAKTAAEKGLSVLLVEKRQEIGIPVRCAEGVSKKSIARFVEIDRKWIAAEVIGAKIYSPDGTEVVMAEEIAGSEVGFVLERKIFDRWLARLAAKAGANVIVKTAAIGLRRNKKTVELWLRRMGEEFSVETKIAIGADGVESRIGSWAGIDTTLKLNEIEACLQYLMTNLSFDPNYTYFWFGNKIAPGGYVWLFPKANTANIGIGVLPSMAKRGVKNYLDAFVKERFPEGRVVEIVAGGVPVKGPIKTAVADNVMLAGDAARHADPLTGGGVANAMKAGFFAANVAAEAIEIRDYSAKTLAKYDELWKGDFGKSLHRNKIIQQKLIKMDDGALNKLAHSIAGYNLKEISVKRIVIELIKRNPKLLWDLKDLFL